MSLLLHINSSREFHLTYRQLCYLLGITLAICPYLLTPWGRIFFDKLIGSHLVVKFPIYYGIRRFITALTSASHLYLSGARSIQSKPPHSISWRSILLLPFHLHQESSKWSLSLRFPHQNPVYTSTFPRTCYVPILPHSSRFDHPNNIRWAVQIIKLHIR